MAISQVPISTDCFTHQVTNPAWKHKPTWYMVATENRSVNPDQERMMAKRARAKTVEVKASYVPAALSAWTSRPMATASSAACFRQGVARPSPSSTGTDFSHSAQSLAAACGTSRATSSR